MRKRGKEGKGELGRDKVRKKELPKQGDKDRRKK